jgi:AcrR family transcriptional regulator
MKSAKSDRARAGEPLELLTMRELVQVCGVPRSTVQFYVREKLLPPPQRLPNNRAIFGRLHADLLALIGRLKSQGLSLDEIRPLVAEAAKGSAFYHVDLAQELDAATRTRVLEAAADEFSKKGYKRARLSDVIRRAGVTPQVFASHFASKKQLFAESFGVAGRRVVERVIPAMERESDVRMKLLARFGRLLRSRQGADAYTWALARAEALYEGGEPAAMAQEVYRQVSALHVEELARLRQKRADDWPPVSDELMAFCILGAEEYLLERLAWDDRFTREDALKAYLLLIAAVHAQYEQDLDLRGCWDSCLEAMRPLLQERPTNAQ